MIEKKGLGPRGLFVCGSQEIIPGRNGIFFSVVPSATMKSAWKSVKFHADFKVANGVMEIFSYVFAIFYGVPPENRC